MYLLVNTLISFSKHNFLEYSVQKVPKNSSKTSLRGSVWNRLSTTPCEENFEFFKEQFCKKCLFRPLKEKWAFYWTFPSHLSVSFEDIILDLEMRNFGLKTTA